MSKIVKATIKRPEVKNGFKSPEKRRNDLSVPSKSPVERVQFLQRTIGNEAVQRLIRSGALHANIGAHGDIYEQAADRVVGQVFSSMPPIQRKCTARCPDDGEKIQRKAEGIEIEAESAKAIADLFKGMNFGDMEFKRVLSAANSLTVNHIIQLLRTNRPEERQQVYTLLDKLPMNDLLTGLKQIEQTNQSYIATLREDLGTAEDINYARLDASLRTIMFGVEGISYLKEIPVNQLNQDDAKALQNFSSMQLGVLSARYESKGDSGTISSGEGDVGGKSYGSYQMVAANANAFVKKFYPKEFNGLHAPSEIFDKKWKEIAVADPEGFEQTQHDFIKETHYDPALLDVNSKLSVLISGGFDVNMRSEAVRRMLWSTAVQHGGYTGPIFATAVKKFQQAHPDADLTDEDLIKGVYAERGRENSAGVLVHFSGNAANVQAGVKNRFKAEQAEALHDLTREQKYRPVPSYTLAVLQPKGASGQIPKVAPETETLVHALKGSGQPLSDSLRASFEPRFGKDFSGVRIHADAEEAAIAVDARAYTVGKDVVFGKGEYAPGTIEGQRLIAHELTHVVQQADGVIAGIQRKPLSRNIFPQGRTNYRFDTGQITMEDLSNPDIIMRLHSMTRGELRAYRASVMDPDVQGYIGRLLAPQPMAQVETDTLGLTQVNMDKLVGLSYWEQRTWKAFDLNIYPARFTNSAEERDAVYTALWQAFPQGPATPPTSKLITLPPNEQRKNALLYEFVISAPAKIGGKARLDIKFHLERIGSVTDSAPEPHKGYIAPPLSFNSDMGFPEGADRYFASHYDELRQISYWIKQQSGSFEQLVVTRSVPRDRKGLPTENLFLVRGKKEKSGALSELNIELRPGGRPVEVTPAEDYRNRDYGDLLLENAQTNPDPKKSDKLGYVNVAGVPADEMVSVKFVIAHYFTEIGTRNAEVDAVVPIAGTKRQVFYTLRFRPDNEVDVERVGEKGSSARLDPSRMDIARVRGYDVNATDPVRLKAWLGKRYPGVKPTGATVEDLRDSANKSMNNDAGTSAWYQANYKVTVIDGKTTQERLRKVHKLNIKQTPDSDNKDFRPDELRLAELSLQTLTETILNLLNYVRLGRKKSSRKADGTIESYGGQTFWNGSNKTVVIYDSGIVGHESAFRGGIEGVNVPEAMLFTHEFGHVMEPMTGAKPAFDKFVKKAGIRPFTHYAESKPDKDFFTEAFAISQTDPEWLRRNHPDVWQWFEKFNRTGKAPK